MPLAVVIAKDAKIQHATEITGNNITFHMNFSFNFIALILSWKLLAAYKFTEYEHKIISFLATVINV